LEGLVSDTLIAAVLGLVAVAVLAPVANHYWTRRRERLAKSRAQLEIEIQVNAYQCSQLLTDHLSKTLPSRNDEKLYGALEALRYCRAYTLFTLSNRSNRTLKGVTVRVENNHLAIPYHFQIDDGPELIEAGQAPLSVGDIRPHQSRKLHLWTRMHLPNFSFSSLAEMFNFSADELDDRTYVEKPRKR
jgi:hypothetical protein